MNASKTVNGAGRHRRHRTERARLSPSPPTPCAGLVAAVAKYGLPPVIRRSHTRSPRRRAAGAAAPCASTGTGWHRRVPRPVPFADSGHRSLDRSLGQGAAWPPPAGSEPPPLMDGATEPPSPPMWVSPSAHACPGRSADAFAWPSAPSWCGQKPLAAASSELRLSSPSPSSSPAATPPARASQIQSLGLWIRQPKHRIGPSGSLPVPPRARLAVPTRTSSIVPHGSARDHPGLWAG